ncbi:MAG: Spy/CpxP family protein refolding chaperone [Xanthobacteraceae bacterium]
MWKTVLAGTAALTIAGSSLVYAQQPGAPPAGPDAQRHWQPSAQDMGAFVDARIAAIKAGVKLTPDQEKNWPAFEQAYRDFAKLRGEQRRARFEQRDESQSADNQGSDGNPINRLERRADALTARGTALKHLADAAGPLYQSLDEAQKHRFLLLSRPHHHDRFAFSRMHAEQSPAR